MLNNLIESSSHTNELKRRGSLLRFTVVTYAVLFVVAGVISIYAYDAAIANPNTESVVMLSPMDFDRPSPAVQHGAPAGGNNNGGNVAVREVAMASVNGPEIAPKTTSAAP